jgi:hypothetical protein
VVLTAIGLIAAVGCGSGGDSTTEVAVTKAEFTKQANGICAKRQKQWEAAAAETDAKYYAIEGKAPRVEEQVANPVLEKKLSEEMVDKTFVPSMKEQLASFEELQAPAGEEAQISRMVEALAQAIEEVEKKGVEGVLNAEGIATFNEKTEAYGLDCTF